MKLEYREGGLGLHLATVHSADKSSCVVASMQVTTRLRSCPGGF